MTQINKVYYSICPDNENYYRTIRLHRNPLTGNIESQVSNVVFGDPESTGLMDLGLFIALCTTASDSSRAVRKVHVSFKLFNERDINYRKLFELNIKFIHHFQIAGSLDLHQIDESDLIQVDIFSTICMMSNLPN